MINDVAIECICDYIRDLEQEQSVVKESYEFQAYSFKIWAARELIRRLDISSKDILDILASFVNEMEMYAVQSDNIAFPIARDAAEDIALLFV